MGVTYAEVLLTGPAGQQATVRFLVDSGATYTLVPHDVWQTLGLMPQRTITFDVGRRHSPLARRFGMPSRAATRQRAHSSNSW